MKVVRRIKLRIKELLEERKLNDSLPADEQTTASRYCTERIQDNLKILDCMYHRYDHKWDRNYNEAKLLKHYDIYL